MALTAEQKEANKTARKARDKAWRERCKLRDAAEAAGKAEIEAGDAMARYRAASAEADALEAAYRQACEETRRIIAEVKAQREAIENEAMRRWHDAGKPASAAWGEKMAADRDLERRLNEQFPDLTGHARWSAASWKPLA